MIGIRGVLFLVFPLILLHYLVNQPLERYPPPVEKHGYFGVGDTKKDNHAVEPFQIEVSEESLQDLKKRIELDRNLPEIEDNLSAISSEFMELLRENVKKFDWKQHEYFLNTFKHYRTEIEGLKIHYIRQALPPTKGKRVVPIMLIHGFPGNFWHFYKIFLVAPLLSNPHRYGFDFGVKESILFDVIIPSLPGFLWSEKPSRLGLGTADVARILSKLIERIGLEKVFVHGGAVLGTEIASAMAVLYPRLILGLHLSNPLMLPFCDIQTTIQHGLSTIGYSNDEDRPSTEIFQLAEIYNKYFPSDGDSIGEALYNSPMGLTRYVMTKWFHYSNGNLTTKRQLNEMFTVDELLTEVHLYWLTDTIPHALRLLENDSSNPNRCKLKLSTVRRPTAIVQSPMSPYRVPKFLLRQKYHNITRYSILPKGGLLHSIQDAHSLAADIFSFVELEIL